MIYETLEQAIKDLKLDRRHKWFVFLGKVVYTHWYTAPCSGCSCDCSDGYGCNHSNAGCRECGYTGKRRNAVPVPAFDKNGNIVEVKQKDNENTVQKNGLDTYAVIRDGNIQENTKTCFTATYKKHEIYVSTDHGFGKSPDLSKRRFDIVVKGEDGDLAVNTWQDLPTWHQAIKYALIGACLIKPDNTKDYS